MIEIELKLEDVELKASDKKCSVRETVPGPMKKIRRKIWLKIVQFDTKYRQFMQKIDHDIVFL
jgi:hypothetical protein